MAENEDGQEKTEEPTSRKLSKARGQGSVAKSQEVSSWFMLFVLLILIGFLLRGLVIDTGGILVRFIDQPEDFSFDPDSAAHFGSSLLEALAAVLFLPVLLLLVAALAAAFIQNGFIFTVDPLKPKLSNLSFKKGFEKVFSLNSIVEFLKGLAKISVVSAVAIAIIWPDMDQVALLITMDVPQVLEQLRWTIFKVVLGVLCVMTLITIMDVAYQRYQHLKNLRMTKEEVKDEHKQTDGDPKVKNRLRRIRIERAKQRMMAAVPDADVVITNPTHYAVALRYDQATMEAPRLLAKGVDSLAQKIRALAKEHEIPIVENAPLARALHASVELDQEIPPEHYKAVAEVIGYLMRVHGKLRSALRREGRLRA